MDVQVVGALIAAVATVLAAVVPLFKRQGRTDKRVDETEKLLRELLTYRPGAIAYGLLVNIRDGSDVRYDDGDEDKKRCLNLLLDDGYLKPAPGISYVHFSREWSGRKLDEIVRATPIAENLIKLRQASQA